MILPADLANELAYISGSGTCAALSWQSPAQSLKGCLPLGGSWVLITTVLSLLTTYLGDSVITWVICNHVPPPLIPSLCANLDFYVPCCGRSRSFFHRLAREPSAESPVSLPFWCLPQKYCSNTRRRAPKYGRRHSGHKFSGRKLHDWLQCPLVLGLFFNPAAAFSKDAVALPAHHCSAQNHFATLLLQVHQRS